MAEILSIRHEALSNQSINHLYVIFSSSLEVGRLFEFICQRQIFDEIEAADYIRQLLTALQYLHNCKIVHLDVKV